jgi:hypothetical protein
MAENAKAARRRERQQMLAELRQGERSGAVIERSGAVIERSGAVIERSGAVIERSGAVIERGMALDDGSPRLVAADIFRKAASLGGHLVVGIVAPLGASTGRSRRVPNGSFSPFEAEAAAARVVLQRMVEQATTKPTDKPSALALNKPAGRSPAIRARYSSPKKPKR